MEDLPAELIEEIAKYLSYEDVLNCSHVSTIWENTFNLDRVWRRFCTLNPNYFLKKISKLSYPLNNNTSISAEPCQFKELFLKEQFVKENLFTEKYHVEEIDLYKQYVDCVRESVDDRGNHWLFLSLMDGRISRNEHKIKVYKINDNAVLQSISITPQGKTTRNLNTELEHHNEKLFYIVDHVVLIHNFANPEYELKYTSYVEFSKPPNSFYSLKMLCPKSLIAGFLYTNHHVLQELSPSYRVWNEDGIPICDNLESFHPLNEITSTSFPLLTAKHNNTNTIVIYYQYTINTKEFFTLKLFDNKVLEYRDFSIKRRGFIYELRVLRNFIIVLFGVKDPHHIYHKGCIITIDMKSGKEIYSCALTNMKIDIRKIKITPSGKFFTVNKKTLTVYEVTDFCLNLVFTVDFKRDDVTVSALGCDYIVVPSGNEDNEFILYHLETGNSSKIRLPLRQNMPGALIPGKMLNFYCEEGNQVALNFVAHTDPSFMYPRSLSRETRNYVYIISFW
ncbi:uncharacterized protein LOC128999146 [Macrosteles quadrilineatus]|uniref:uncharacterized protein LOC128999146 n=1 Tax=Macrosteles quadrilineatus TaxID=74068 RepID=UPI0023E0EA20|nr:uncharacterized protein LOC128999146 [Macrosteles quadrilineatus]